MKLNYLSTGKLLQPFDRFLSFFISFSLLFVWLKMNDSTEASIEIVASVQSVEETADVASEEFPYNSDHESSFWQHYFDYKKKENDALIGVCRKFLIAKRLI
jgi:hypothetical protein